MIYFPANELERQYVNTITAVIVVLSILLVIAVALSITFICLYVKGCNKPKHNAEGKIGADVTESEVQVLAEYRKLDEQSKELVKNTINTLNSKLNKD